MLRESERERLGWTSEIGGEGQERRSTRAVEGRRTRRGEQAKEE
jgi:hypothetical protein